MSLADRTPGPAGSGLIAALPLGQPSKKRRSGRGRHDPVFTPRKVVISVDKTDFNPARHTHGRHCLAGRGVESEQEGCRMKTKAKLSPWTVGKNYLIRTVTYHITGRLEGVFDNELVLSSAAWIADSGRFTQAVASSEFCEVEPFPKDRLVTVGRGSVVDAVEIPTLPSVQK